MNEHENELTMEALQWIVSTIAERNEDAQKEASCKEENPFAHGRAEAYWEIMDIIQSRVEILGVDVKAQKAG